MHVSVCSEGDWSAFPLGRRGGPGCYFLAPGAAPLASGCVVRAADSVPIAANWRGGSCKPLLVLAGGTPPAIVTLHRQIERLTRTSNGSDRRYALIPSARSAGRITFPPRPRAGLPAPPSSPFCGHSDTVGISDNPAARSLVPSPVQNSTGRPFSSDGKALTIAFTHT